VPVVGEKTFPRSWDVKEVIETRLDRGEGTEDKMNFDQRERGTVSRGKPTRKKKARTREGSFLHSRSKKKGSYTGGSLNLQPEEYRSKKERGRAAIHYSCCFGQKKRHMEGKEAWGSLEERRTRGRGRTMTSIFIRHDSSAAFLDQKRPSMTTAEQPSIIAHECR